MIIVIIAIEIIILVLMAIVKMTIVIIAIVIIIIVMMISHCKVKNTYHDRQSGCKDFLLFPFLNVDFGTVQTE